MERKVRRKLVFIVGSVGAFTLACVASAFSMIWVIGWYMSNCAVASSGCKVALWLIDFWWLLFVPAILLAAMLIHRLYTRDKAIVPAHKI